MPVWNIDEKTGLARLKNIKWIVLDVDGVLTDGTIYMTDTGSELKGFHVQDGQGLKMWQRAGNNCAIITGRSSKTVSHRAHDLGIEYLYQGAKDKLEVFQQFLKDSGALAEEVCFIGDDLVELPIFWEIAMGIAVADAVPEVLEAAGLITERNGGRGAVREVVDFMLKEQGLWPKVTARYYANK